MKKTWAVLCCAFLTMGIPSAYAESASETLEKAIYAEETTGDLDGAAALYAKATSQATGDDATAAQSQFRLGQCLLKQKKGEQALSAFQKVVNAYSSQTEWCEKAKKYFPTTLKYDDGGMETKMSMAGGGHAILFECPSDGEWYVDEIRIFGARYGTTQAPHEDFFIYVTDRKMDRIAKIAKPYATFKKGDEKWQSMKFTPVKVPKEFYICVVFNPTQTKGVYVGMDENVSESHSKNATPGNHVEDLKKKADWMIRAHITPISTGKTIELMTKKEQESSHEKDVSEQESKLLKGEKSIVLKHDGGRMDKFQSLGGPSAQTVAFEAPADASFVYSVSIYASQYGGQHDSEAVNGDIYILDEKRNVISRTPFPYSLLTQQKDWVDIPVMPTKVKGKFFVALHAHSEQFKGVYLGYQENVARSYSSVSEVTPPQFKKAENDKQLEWMLRAKMTSKPVYFEATPESEAKASLGNRSN